MTGKEPASYWHVASVVTLYWAVSISMVFLNKALVSGSGSISAPLFVTWFQCVVTCVICWVCGELGYIGGGKEKDLGTEPGFFSKFPRAQYHLPTVAKVMPLTLVFVGMITCNNLTLKYVEVSFYNVARSLTIVFNVLFSYLILGNKTSFGTALCLLVVMAGFVVGTEGEVHFSLLGTLFGVASSVFVSLNSIFTKKVLQHVGNDHWRLTFINNANACLLFVPLIVCFESRALLESGMIMYNPVFWGSMVVAGFFGFAIGIVAVMQIRCTSPLTHNISGTAKAAFQTVLAFYIWKNPATFKGCLGIAMILLGSAVYTAVKIRESQQAPPRQPLPK